MMNLKTLFFSIPVGLLLSASALAGVLVIKKPEVRTIVTSAGYGEPKVIVQDGEL